jgi:hypothetical protein
MDVLILIFAALIWIILSEQRKELTIPGLVCLYIIFVLIGKRREYISTDEEMGYISKLQSMSMNVVDDKVKNVPVYPYSSSFTDNKEKIYLCVKDKRGKFFSPNDMIYVLLHEYAHATTRNERDPHGPKWRKNFHRYLKIAESKGLYDRSKVLPIEYMTECG